MSHTRYIVRSDGSGTWKIILDGRNRGSYATRDEAIHRAVETAHQIGAVSRDGARVLIQRADGTLVNAWTYGHDPFPLADRALP